MTREEIVNIAQEAGVWEVVGYPKCIDRFAHLIMEHCAKIAEIPGMTPRDIARAIRERGETL